MNISEKTPLMHNSSSSTTEEMPQSGKSWIDIIVIITCIVFTQAIAYFATPQKTLEERRYVLNILALYTMAVQWIAFIHAGGLFGNERTEKYYDLVGSLTFLTTLAISLYLINGKITARQIVLSTFVAIWSARLGWFLFTRIHNNSGVDSRFTELKKSLTRFLMAWTMQGMWVFFTMIPVLILNQYTKNIAFGIYDYIGMPIWIVGFLFEVIADYQKSAFRKIAENKHSFIHSGLWSISRHPNYFGEILMWIGISLSAFGGLGAKPRGAFAFISPVFVALLLIFVSGIPLLEQKADKKFADNEAYQHYKENTPVLVPFIGRKGDAMF
ncbi:CLUMA_CG006603, isoform A [Clunio marinus]|uniref:CLUMA_CG006603, isoform A n=1 Tax=Clunio marinus TaxID=568069 RepID=A0A1J1HY49_9DIPT|nr:CLUMA_CG006603, isoform A [Clunio marinus]